MLAPNMRTIVFRLGSKSRADLQDFLHSRLNFEFNDITWLEAGAGNGDRVPVRFFNDVLALRALVLWGLYRWQTRPAARPDAVPATLRVSPIASPHSPRQLIAIRRLPTAAPPAPGEASAERDTNQFEEDDA